MGSIPGWGRFLGGGQGNPLYQPWLENPMERGAWPVMVHRVEKSQTWLKWLSIHTDTDFKSTLLMSVNQLAKKKTELCLICISIWEVFQNLVLLSFLICEQRISVHLLRLLKCISITFYSFHSTNINYLVAQIVKNHLYTVQSLGKEDPLKKEMATNFSF